jgi:hypothetical protein
MTCARKVYSGSSWVAAGEQVMVTVLVVVIVLVEVTVFVGPALLVAAFPVTVTVLTPCPMAKNRLAEIRIPAMTIAKAMVR